MTSPSSRWARAEVRDVRLAGPVEEDVLRLHIPVDDAMAVGMVEGPRGPRHDARRFLPARPVADHPLGQRFALDEAADDVGDAALEADLVDLHDAWMAELGRVAGLAQEAVLVLRGGEGSGPRDLHGDDARQLGIVGLVHRSEGASSEEREHLEAADALRLSLRRQRAPVLLDAERAPAARARGLRLQVVDRGRVAAVRAVHARHARRAPSRDAHHRDQPESPLEPGGEVGVARRHRGAVRREAGLRFLEEGIRDLLDPDLHLLGRHLVGIARGVAGVRALDHRWSFRSRSRTRMAAW